jgi:hypothetical protein
MLCDCLNDDRRAAIQMKIMGEKGDRLLALALNERHLHRQARPSRLACHILIVTHSAPSTQSRSAAIPPHAACANAPVASLCFCYRLNTAPSFHHHAARATRVPHDNSSCAHWPGRDVQEKSSGGGSGAATPPSLRERQEDRRVRSRERNERARELASR